MNQLNRKLAADIESVYLMASPEYSFLSSSGIKEMATFGADDRGSGPAVRREGSARSLVEGRQLGQLSQISA